MKSISNYIYERVVPDGVDPDTSKEKKESKTSNSSLLYRIGCYNLNWKMREDQKRLIDKYDIRGGNCRKNIIKWQRKVSYPLLPDELEVVHRKDWELDILHGVGLDALYHKHYTMWFDNMYKNFKPRNKVLTVFECSNKKPYCFVQSTKQYVTKYSDFSDFASIAYGIIPWDFTNLYPVRWDEWDHYSEDPYMAYCYSEATKKGILEFHKKFPQYEKIIFVCQNDKPQRPANELWEDNTDNFRDWAIILTDDDFREGVKRHFGEGVNMGIVIQRTLVCEYTKKKYAECLAEQYSDQKSKDTIMSRLKMSASECEKEGLYNMYDPDIAKFAYEKGVLPCDSKFMEDYKKEHIINKDMEKEKKKEDEDK